MRAGAGAVGRPVVPEPLWAVVRAGAVGFAGAGKAPDALALDVPLAPAPCLPPAAFPCLPPATFPCLPPATFPCLPPTTAPCLPPATLRKVYGRHGARSSSASEALPSARRPMGKGGEPRCELVG